MDEQKCEHEFSSGSLVYCLKCKRTYLSLEVENDLNRDIWLKIYISMIKQEVTSDYASLISDQGLSEVQKRFG